MATTKVHAITKTLNKALDYIEDPSKTEEQLLVSGFNVDPLTASVEFALTVDQARQVKGDYSQVGGSNNLAYHLIQSFAPEDISRGLTPELAHEIGKKLADELLGGKYEYVIATHVNTGCIHNHIIFNATSFADFKKWDPGYKGSVKRRIEKISDRLCAEHGLSVIKENWTQKLKGVLDQAIEESDTFADFLAQLGELGVEVKQGAQLSFRLAGMKKFRRGDMIQGKQYTVDGIKRRIERKKPKPPSSARYAKWLERKARREAGQKETTALMTAIMTIRNEGITRDGDFVVVGARLSGEAAEIRGKMDQLTQKAEQYAQAVKYLRIVRQAAEILRDPHNATLRDAGGNLLYTAEFHAMDQLGKMKVDANVDPEKVMALVDQLQEQVAAMEKELAIAEKRTEALETAREMVRKVKGIPAPEKGKSGEKQR